jgi:hypothetical protein
MRLTRNDPRGAKRTKPRVEELIKISVHGIVTNRGGLHTIRDKNGTLLQFVDEVENGQMVLKIYQDSLPILTYQLAEKPIKGWIKNHSNWRADCSYFVVINGKRYRYLYVDVANKKIGSKDCFGAVWTSESIGAKQKTFWREYRRIQKKADRL